MKMFKYIIYLILSGILCLLFGCTGLPIDEKGDGTLLNLKEAVKKGPQNPETHIELAHLYGVRYQETKKIYFLDAGIKEALEAVRLRPTFRDAHLFIGHLLFLKSYPSLDERIIDELKKIQTVAMKEDPNFIGIEHFIPYQYFSGFIYYDKASKENKYLDMAAKEFKEVIRLKPDLPGGHSMLGNIYFIQGKDELALFEAKEAVRLNSESYSSHLLLGDIYKKKSYSEKDCYDDEMIDLSIKEFKEAIRLNPDSYYPHSMLGYLYRSKGLYDLSIFESKEALRLRGSPDNHVQLGIAFDRNGEYDEAVKEFNEALRLNPNFMMIHGNLGWEYFLLNRFIDSIAEVKKYRRSSGPEQPVDIILCQYLSMKQTGEISSSVQLLEDYAKNFKDKDWKFNLVQYLLGKVSETEVMGSTRHRCDQAIVFFFIGYDFLAKGDKQKAIEYFQKAVDTKVFGYKPYAAASKMLQRLSD